MLEINSELSKQSQYRDKSKAQIGTERIFMIAKSELLIESYAIELKSLGYQLEIFYDSISAALAIHHKEPDLIIVDCSICSTKSQDIFYSLRSIDNDIPLIAVTKNPTAIDKAELLDAGADCCLSKSLSTPRFLAIIQLIIIQARLRQEREHKSPILKFEDLKLNFLTRQVERGDRSISLSSTEFILLEYFMQHPLQILTRNQIIKRIWGNNFRGDFNIVQAYTRCLQMKLEITGEKRLIHIVGSADYVLRSK